VFCPVEVLQVKWCVLVYAEHPCSFCTQKKALHTCPASPETYHTVIEQSPASLLLPHVLPHMLAPQEATEALKPVLGDYYSKDGRNVLQALWQEMSLCHFVAPERDGSGVLWFATHTKSDVVSATAAAAAGFNPDKAAKAA